MPSWCSNTLIIRGKTSKLEESSKLEEFRRRAVGIRPAYAGVAPLKETVLEFSNFVPIPKEVLEAGYDKAGYDWEIENWGVKWGAIDSEVSVLDMELEYKFSTPWCAPIKWLEQVAAQYPDLMFHLQAVEPSSSEDLYSWTYAKGELVTRVHTETFQNTEFFDNDGKSIHPEDEF